MRFSTFRFFSCISFPHGIPLGIQLELFKIFIFKLFTLIAVINDTGDKQFTGVNDTGDKLLLYCIVLSEGITEKKK